MGKEGKEREAGYGGMQKVPRVQKVPPAGLQAGRRMRNRWRQAWKWHAKSNAPSQREERKEREFPCIKCHHAPSMSRSMEWRMGNVNTNVHGMICTVCCWGEERILDSGFAYSPTVEKVKDESKDENPKVLGD